jgi:hypothetical protein
MELILEPSAGQSMRLGLIVREQVISLMQQASPVGAAPHGEEVNVAGASAPAGLHPLQGAREAHRSMFDSFFARWMVLRGKDLGEKTCPASPHSPLRTWPQHHRTKVMQMMLPI